jgi:hypothetical protein
MSFPRMRESSEVVDMLDSRLRGNDNIDKHTYVETLNII